MCAAHGKKYGSFPLEKLHLPVSKSLLTQEIWLRLGFIQCIFRGEGSGEREEFLPLLAEWKLERYALKFNSFDAGWVACGEKLNRSLCSLKIKLFLDAGGGNWGLFNAFSGEREVGRGKSFCHS